MTLQDFPKFFIEPFDLDLFRHLGTRLSLGYPAAAPAVELLETQFRLGEHRFVFVVKPPEIVRKLEGEFIKIAKMPDVVAHLKAIGVDAVGEKLERARTTLQAARDAGREVVIAWPKANHADAAPQIEALKDLGATFVEPETVAELLGALGLDIPDFSVLGAPVLRGRPYLGLERFEEQHRAIFFGRGQARDKALDKLKSCERE